MDNILEYVHVQNCRDWINNKLMTSRTICKSSL